ncbi:MAG: HEPN domain-containing protein [Armatimonadota bacterium]
MDGKLLELAKYRIEKAKSDLESSELMLQNGKFAQSLNRSYYAIFHATRALLAFDKFDSKKHSGIISYFNQNYIKAQKIDVKYGQILMAAEKIRVQSDYDDFYVANKQSADAQIINAREFIDKIEEYINEIK